MGVQFILNREQQTYELSENRKKNTCPFEGAGVWRFLKANRTAEIINHQPDSA
jgi:hypothetical protein